MNQNQRVKLDEKLWALCSAQDTVTHNNEHGLYMEDAKRERRQAMDAIMSFVEELTAKKYSLAEVNDGTRRHQ